MSFILYIAILLVLLGALFLYTSVEVRKVPPGAAKNQVRADEEALPEIDLPPLVPGTSPVAAETHAAGMADNEAAVETDADSDDQNDALFPISLYIDEKGAVPFDDERGIKDDAAVYAGLTRVGGGIAEVLPDSVNVRIEKKFFRYDFYRIQEIKSKGAAAGIFVKGDYRGNIFIAENERFAKVLMDKFTRYTNKG